MQLVQFSNGMKDINALKFLFVAVMLLVTFWTRSGRIDVSEIHATAIAKEEVTVPTVANAVAVFAAPPEEVLVASTSTPEGETKPLPTERVQSRFVKSEPIISPPASVARPLVYPKINFDVRANSIRELTAGKLSSFLISDLLSGEEVYSQASLRRWPIASLTKLMTAIIATEKIGLTKQVMISQDAVDTFGDAGGLQAGEVFTVENLLKPLLLVSSNDAAIALAESFGKNEFMAAMNEKAHELHMSEATHFVDPIGLDSRNQSTPVDLEKLIAYIYMNEPQILRITREREGKIKDIAKGAVIRFQNINEFAGESGFLGGKTGFIDESSGNLVSLFSVAGRPILVVVLGSDNRFEVTRQLLNWFTGNYAITSGN